MSTVAQETADSSLASVGRSDADADADTASVEPVGTEPARRLIDECLQLHGSCAHVSEHTNRRALYRHSRGAGPRRQHQRDEDDHRQ